jgi:hypothetical protein
MLTISPDVMDNDRSRLIHVLQNTCQHKHISSGLQMMVKALENRYAYLFLRISAIKIPFLKLIVSLY